ncbi:MAG: hypothetical protein MUD01_16665, partial [Chloroflexaceae bacterium]|nr:hypothetical protein [Chloroflexaceae bacterium]
MQRFFTWLLTVHHQNLEQQRRGQIVITMAIGLALLGLANLPIIAWAGSASPLVSGVIFLYVLVCSALILLTRYGYVRLSAWVLVVFLTLAPLSVMLFGQRVGTSPYLLLLGILVCSLVLPPRHALFLLAFALAALW